MGPSPFPTPSRARAAAAVMPSRRAGCAGRARPRSPSGPRSPGSRARNPTSDDVVGLQVGWRSHRRHHLRRPAAQGDRERHPVQEARRCRLGRVEVGIGVQVDETDVLAEVKPRPRHDPGRERAVAAQHDGEALRHRPRHLVGGGAHRARHHLRIARLRVLRVVAEGKKRQVGEVDHGGAGRTQRLQQARLAQTEGGLAHSRRPRARGRRDPEHRNPGPRHAVKYNRRPLKGILHECEAVLLSRLPDHGRPRGRGPRRREDPARDRRCGARRPRGPGARRLQGQDAEARVLRHPAGGRTRAGPGRVLEPVPEGLEPLGEPEDLHREGPPARPGPEPAPGRSRAERRGRRSPRGQGGGGGARGRLHLRQVQAREGRLPRDARPPSRSSSTPTTAPTPRRGRPATRGSPRT